jgi:hypothetical protein
MLRLSPEKRELFENEGEMERTEAHKWTMWGEIRELEQSVKEIKTNLVGDMVM